MYDWLKFKNSVLAEYAIIIIKINQLINFIILIVTIGIIDDHFHDIFLKLNR